MDRGRFFTGELNDRGLADISWRGCQLNSPGWTDAGARSLAFTLGGQGDESDVHVIMNMYWDSLTFELPKAGSRKWRRVIDTSLPSPDDIIGLNEANRRPIIDGGKYIATGRSVVVLAT